MELITVLGSVERFSVSERIHGRIKKRIGEKFKGEMQRADISMSALLNKILEAYFFPNVSCHQLAFRGETYVCVQGRRDRTPIITKLAVMISDKDDICAACERGRAKDIKIEELSQELERKKSINMPSCLGGANLREREGVLELQCMNPEYGAYKWRDVHKFCKVARRGANCELLSWNQITVQGKLVEGDNR